MGHKRASCIVIASVVLAWGQMAGIFPNLRNGHTVSAFHSPVTIAGTAGVAINELVASNVNGLLDEDGDTSDWIEILNSTNASVDLTGWGLTDHSSDPWIFPALTVPVNSYVVVFASGKDRASPGSQLHTDFKMEGRSWERATSVELINPDGSTAFQVNAGVRIHGGYTRRPDVTPKHSLRLYFRDDYGQSQLDHDLFPESPVSSFDVLVLRAAHNDSWLYGSRGVYVRDQWIRDTELAMGHIGAHGTYVQLYINGLYWGLYNLAERIDEHFVASYFGGSEDSYDIIKGWAQGQVTASNGNTLAWDDMTALAEEGLASNDDYLAIQQYLDLASLIDYMLLHIYAGTYGDWLAANWFAVRHRAPGAGFQFLSWDNEFSLQYVDIDNTGLGPNEPNSPAFLYWKLRDNSEFRLLFADHVQRHFFNGGVFFVDPASPQWDPAHPERNVPAARFVQRTGEIEGAIVTESARWGDWKRPDVIYNRDDHWIVERDRLLTDFFPQRSATVLQQLRSAGLYPSLDAPAFSQHGGAVPSGFQLSMSAPQGAVYFTTDGSDPRTPVSGAISPTATRYSAPIILPGGSTRVKARALSAATWSALTEATFTAPQDLSHLHISEIMYNPIGGDGFEYLEVKNCGAFSLNLTGVTFARGIDFAFPPAFTLSAGQLAVLVSNPVTFTSRYPNIPVAGTYAGHLANEGERVTLRSPEATTILDFTYDDETGWPTTPDGDGYSLVLANLAGDPTLPANWRPSTFPNGSPGADDPIPFSGDIVINEVLAHSDPPLEDAIELYNPSNVPIDLSGWFLSDSPSTLQKYRIPDGTVIQPSSYVVFYEYQFNAFPGTAVSFALSSLGDQVFLSAAAASGTLTGYTTAVDFDASPANTSLGRFSTASTEVFPLLGLHTFGVSHPLTVQQFRTGTGSLNAYPSIGPVVIDEIMYHPAPGGHEFIELLNVTDTPVPLFDPAHPASTWQLTHGVSYTFPANTVIPPRQLALVVGVQPEAFRISYTVPISVPIFGPFDDSLSNGGERVTLARPDHPTAGTIPLVAVDDLRFGSDTSTTVRWRTDINSTSRVLFGLSPSALTWSVESTASTREHEVTLNGLSPDTRYYYAIGTTTLVLAGADNNHYFVTSPSPGSSRPTRIWVLGDSGLPGSNQWRVRDAYYTFTGSRHTDLWLMLGDNAYQSGTDAEYQAAVFASYPATLRTSVLWPTLGNHDGVSSYAATQTGPYFDIFTLPTAAQAGGVPSNTEAYYSFDYGAIHFIVIDSDQLIWTALDTMRAWLQADLASVPQDRWIVAFWHNPPYTKGSHDSDTSSVLIRVRAQLLPTLEAGGVDLVLSGHSHSYERSFLLDGHYGSSTTLTPAMILNGGNGRPSGDGPYVKSPGAHQGTVYAVVGSSSMVTAAPLNHPAMAVSLVERGSLVLDVDGSRLDATFVTDYGELADTFTIIKAPPCYFADVQPNGDHGQPNLCDGDVDAADLGRVTACWNEPVTAQCPASLDVNRSGGAIDLSDIIAVSEQWGWRR